MTTPPQPQSDAAQGWFGVARCWDLEEARKEAKRMDSYREYAVVIRRLCDGKIVWRNKAAREAGL